MPSTLAQDLKKGEDLEMGTHEVVDTDKEVETTKEEKPKRKRRRQIVLIEVPPKPEWTVCAKNEKGRELWWLRASVTGLRTRRFGPFKSQQVALLVLDDILSCVDEALVGAAAEFDGDLVTGRFAKRYALPIIEDELTRQEA